MSKEEFESWINKERKPNYIKRLENFWSFFNNQKEIFSDDFNFKLNELVENRKNLFNSIHTSKKSLFDMDIDELDVLSEFKKLLNQRSGPSKGGSEQSAGLTQLIDWRKKEKSEQSQNMLSSRNSLTTLSLSKPFILLAGISGTGKSRFVREQARLSSVDPSSDSKPENFELVSVRPDWHEPSDLLGYVTRLSGKPQFVSTDVLKFMVKAWKAIEPTAEDFNERKFTFKPDLKPFWLCLDEMNLAPVEQYFADYLSVLETRKIEGNHYSCDPLIKSSAFKDLLPSQDSNDYSGVYKLAQDLGLNLDDVNDKQLLECFLNHGIPLPYNLIVAGTVNMDETTHGFSRKVIDRALTLDFGEFFPNDFDQYGKNAIQPVALSYPALTHIDSFDTDALNETREFLKNVNRVLEGTMFELAYRALNEALLMVHSFQPDSEEKLCAVWDDFLMMKVLPRIEGDEDKLAVVNEENSENQNLTVLQKLEAVLNPVQKVEQTDSINAQNLASTPEESTVEDSDDSNTLDGLSSKMLAPIWTGAVRPDLLREGAGNIECRSKKKIEQMQTKLKRGFTTFWP